MIFPLITLQFFEYWSFLSFLLACFLLFLVSRPTSSGRPATAGLGFLLICAADPASRRRAEDRAFLKGGGGLVGLPRPLGPRCLSDWPE